MNILFISIAWPKTGERNLYTDLMDEFVIHGHSVYVVGTIDSEARCKSELRIENKIHVLRIFSGKIRKTSYFRKVISLFTLDRKILKAIRDFYSDSKFDLIIAPTPPITLSRLYKKLKKSNNASFYLLLKDIWPQGSVDLQVISKYSIPWFYLRFHEIRIYKTADFIGCMSPKGVDYILSNNKYLIKDKIEVCPNSIHPNARKAEKSELSAIRTKYSIPQDACVFILCGNLGIGHGLGFLAETMSRLKDYQKAFFIIGGSGTHFNIIKSAVDEFRLKNTFLYNWLPREEFEQIMEISDVGLILLDNRYTVPQFPSRLLSYLNAGKSVLCAVNNNTDIGMIIEDAGCGKSVQHGNYSEFIDAIVFFSENEEERDIMGKNARKLLLEKYDVRDSYLKIMCHFNN